MLTLRKIEVEDFGPFVGRQVLDLPAEGVTVIYGENARGKTTLLNAIRYAFYGKVLQHGARQRQLPTFRIVPRRCRVSTASRLFLPSTLRVSRSS